MQSSSQLVPLGPSERAPRTAADWAPCLAALVFVAVLGIPTLLYPLHADQALFAYIGDVWIHGGLPYRDAWDIKPPGIFALYALAEAAFGRSMAAAHAGDLVATLLAAAGLYAMLRRRFRPALAVLAPLFLGIAYFTVFDYSETAQVESYAAPFSVLLAYSVLRWRDRPASLAWSCAAGLCVACLALLKAPFLLLGALLLFRPRTSTRRSFAAFAFGMLAPLLATGAYFAAYGAFGVLTELMAAQRAYGGRFEGGLVHVILSWPQWLGTFLRHRPFFDVLLVLALLPSRLQPHWQDRRMAYLWLALSGAAVLAQWRLFFYHYVLILPPLSLMAAAALAGQMDGRAPASARPRLLKAVAVLLVLGLPVAFDVGRFRIAWLAETGRISRSTYWALFAVPGYYPFSNTAAVADCVASNSSRQDRIMVYDFDPAIYFLADRASATRHVSILPLYLQASFPDTMRRRWQRELIAQASVCPPRILVVSGFPKRYGMSDSDAQEPPQIHFAGRRYRAIARFTKDRVYRLTDAAGAESSHRSGLGEVRSGKPFG